RAVFEAVADLDFASNRFRQLLNCDPIVVTHRESLFLRIIADHDPIELGLNPDNVLRTPCRTDALALADGVLVNSGVRTDDIAGFRDNISGLTRLHPGILLDEIRIRSAFNEAD